MPFLESEVTSMAKTLVYQLYPIAWEKQGGLKAMTEHLGVINFLGADYVWISPIYPSPRCDHGYDVAEYMEIDPRFGTMADFDYFVKVAHSHGIGVLMDLVLNHTSTEHPWFKGHPEYYCWAEKESLPKWKNLFDDSDNTWEYDPNQQKCYLHMFHKNQADLNWFPWQNRINNDLVKEFQKIIRFWGQNHNVDGFRLDFPQALNKNLEWPEMDISGILFGDRAKSVIKTLFQDGRDYFIIMECLDPTYGGLTEHYYKGTPISYVLNMAIKDAFQEGEQTFERIVKSASSDSGFMLDFESHDSMRFPSRGIDPKEALEMLFSSEADGICLYQGQELGLKNPTPIELPDSMLLELDAQTSMRVARGGSIDKLRLTSRANARIPLPLDEYKRQFSDPNSFYNLTKNLIDEWKTS